MSKKEGSGHSENKKLKSKGERSNFECALLIVNSLNVSSLANFTKSFKIQYE